MLLAAAGLPGPPAGAGLTGTVTDGPLAAALAVSVLVGVVGFASPCVLPLVPGYLSYVSGLSGADTVPGRARQLRMAGGALLFVGGFSAVFIASGALFGQLGNSIQDHLPLLQRIAGGVTVLLGLVFLGAFPRFQREVKVHRLPRAGLAGAPLLGATFGLAWAPCLTPTFTAVYSLAVSAHTAGRGALLLAAYCLGLGVPFVLVALGFGWMGGAVGFLRRHAGAVSRVGGGMLILLGVLMALGVWTEWVRTLQGSFSTVGIEI